MSARNREANRLQDLATHKAFQMVNHPNRSKRTKDNGARNAPNKCERCEAEDISPVVEAFELSGQIVCEDCAEEVFQENSQFGVGA